MKKIFVILMLGILLIGTISALTDKSFNKNIGNYGKVELTSRSWIDVFGWFENPVEDIELKSNTFSCLINCEAVKEITLYQDGKLVDDIRFMNLAKTKETSINSYFFYTKIGTKEKVIDDFERQCIKGSLLGNGSYSQSCSNVKVGSHIETEDVWKEYNFEEVKAGSYTLKLVGKKEVSQSVDWQIMSQGKWITDWAVWTDSLNVGLVSYYDFNEGSGTNLIDNVTGINNGILKNFVAGDWKTGADCKLNGCLNFTGTNKYVNISYNSNLNLKNYTINFWLKKTGIGSAGYLNILSRQDYDAYNSNYIIAWDSPYIVGYQGNGAGAFLYQAQSNGLTLDRWEMVTLAVDSGSNMTLYQNGTVINTDTTATGSFYSNTVSDLLLGYSFASSGRFLQGSMDDLGIWNRTLTASEISDLYNGGTGITYVATGGGTSSLLINLTSPLNNANFSITTINFTTNITPIISNITNATLFIWRSNYSLFNKTTNSLVGNESNVTSFEIYGFVVDNYKWNVLACNNNSNCSYATSNYSFLVGATVNNITYLNTTFETQTQLITAEVSILPTSSLTQAYLIYNGTSYTADSLVNTVGYDYLISKTLNTPLNINSYNIENRSFYWNLKYADGTEQNSSSYIQEVKPIILIPCNTTYNVKTLNFTTYDEVNNSLVNNNFNVNLHYFYNSTGTIYKTLAYSNTSETTYERLFCINLNNTNLSITGTVSYGSTGYDTRYHLFSSRQINNNTQNIPLYLASVTSSDIVTFTLIDQSFSPVIGATIEIDKWDIGHDIYLPVNFITTDDNGKASSNLILYSTTYVYKVYYNGILYLTTSPAIESSTSKTLQISLISIPSYQGYNSLNYSLTFNSSNNFTVFSYVGNSSVTEGCLIIRNNTLYDQTQIYNSCLSLSAGIIQVEVSTPGDYLAYAVIFINDKGNSLSQIVASIEFSNMASSALKIFKSYGQAASLILIGTSALVGVAAGSIPLGLGLIFASVLFVKFIGFLNFATTFSLIISIIILILITSRRRYR